MGTRVADRIDEWEERPFEGGYRGLHRLAEEGFSGAVRAGGAELLMTKGTVVGVRRGSIEDFEEATGTGYESPTPALPLLAVMQERSDEVRAKYYTEKTPISEVDRTLEDGKFTGYVELSENVLSGDYYLVYHQGRSMSVAYVGSAGRLIHGDEAFEQAEGEVGIYEVRPVAIEPVEIPEATGGTDAADGAGGDGPSEGGAPGTDPGDEPAAATGESAASAGESGATDQPEPPEPTGGTATETRDAEAADPSDGPADPSSARETGDDPGMRADSAAESAPEREADGTDRTADDAGTDDPGTGGSRPETRSEERAGGTQEAVARGDGRTAGGATDRPADTTAGGSGSSADPASLATRAIPSLDPARTSADTAPETSAPEATADAAGPTERPSDPGDPRASDADPAGREPELAARVEELESALDRRDEEIRRLEDDLQTTRAERDELRTRLEQLQEERDELRTQLEQLRERSGERDDGADTRLRAGEALDGTDLFLRYDSKGNATLEKAHGGSVDRTEVRENLRLETHTQFAAEDATVEGQAYETFLEDRVEFSFVRWVVRDLLFEIQNTGHTESLLDLYDAIPEINRVEIDGAVTVETEEGERTESFDLVFRERMGDPLLVANINDSRQGASQAMMEELITAAERVGQSTDRFAAAFLVTRSFFEPEALETVAEATRGGLLSRDKRASFVNLSRKRGYHLCLVEARNENFHLEVPEL